MLDKNPRPDPRQNRQFWPGPGAAGGGDFGRGRGRGPGRSLDSDTVKVNQKVDQIKLHLPAKLNKGPNYYAIETNINKIETF